MGFGAVMRVDRLAWCIAAVAVAFGCGGESHHKSDDAAARGGTSGSGAAAGGTGNQGTAAYGNFATMIEEGGRTICGDAGCVVEPFVDPIDPPGPSLCGGVECAAGEMCCMLSSRCFDPLAHPEDCATPPDDHDSLGRTACSSNADCEYFEFCRADNAALCQGPGHCMPIANCGGCGPADECVTCACDGNTYPDRQTACLARVNTPLIPGACGVPITVGGAGAGGAAQMVTRCGADANCAEGELCCAITSLCYPATNPGRCQVPPPGTDYPCSSNADCLFGGYCLGPSCDGPGGCVPMANDECGVRFEPVCGCDRVTYTSAACASAVGVRVASDGTCEKP